MVESVTFAPPPTGTEAPASPPPILSGTDKALADTKAELTRVQQELAALKKEAAPSAPSALPTAGEGAPPVVAPAADGAVPGDAPDKAEQQTQEAAAQAVASAGLDVSPWQTEFDTTGDVSEDGRARIAEALKAQFGDAARAVVDQFIDGRKATQAAYEAQLAAAAGGMEAYQEMAAWARTALTEAEAQQYNAAVQSGNRATAEFAIKGLHSRFVAANGSAPSLLTAGAPSSTPSGFRSVAEMTAAMRDPRYKSDPAYRAEVEQKTIRASF